MKFRKKPVVIEAFQMTRERGASTVDWPDWLQQARLLERGSPGSLYPTDENVSDSTLAIATLEGEHIVSWGDWIIRGVAGELYPCKPHIFDLTYEEASATDEITRLRARIAELERFWTPVTESLPDLDVPVWLTDGKVIWIGARSDSEDGWLWGHCYDGWCYSKGLWLTSRVDTDDDYRPTHWAHLPRPPKG
jgi:hypothetical protein